MSEVNIDTNVQMKGILIFLMELKAFSMKMKRFIDYTFMVVLSYDQE